MNQQRESALKRLSDVHDVHMPLCPAILSEFSGMKYAWAHTITRQCMLAGAPFLIENPDKAADRKAANLAANTRPGISVAALTFCRLFESHQSVYTSPQFGMTTLPDPVEIPSTIESGI